MIDGINRIQRVTLEQTGDVWKIEVQAGESLRIWDGGPNLATALLRVQTEITPARMHGLQTWEMFPK